MTVTRVVICMPTFNEGRKLANFLQRLDEEFAQDQSIDLTYIVIDDCSTDDSIANAASLDLRNVFFIKNEVNLGHGPSTIKALTHALVSEPDVVCGADGDGEVEASSIKELISKAHLGSAFVVEGSRINRSDPWFRKLISWTTRQLVKSKSGIMPIDANTPFRAYKPEALKELLGELPGDSMIPNIHISSITRAKGLAVSEIPLRLRIPSDRSSGITWRQRFKSLPSKKFLGFCANAFREWVRS